MMRFWACVCVCVYLLMCMYVCMYICTTHRYGSPPYVFVQTVHTLWIFVYDYVCTYVCVFIQFVFPYKQSYFTSTVSYCRVYVYYNMATHICMYVRTHARSCIRTYILLSVLSAYVLMGEHVICNSQTLRQCSFRSSSDSFTQQSGLQCHTL